MTIKYIFRIALCTYLLVFGAVQAAAPLPKLGTDKSQTTVSGLSSGGFMAVQLHVAYSDTFNGAGIVAGGPYYCAENSFFSAIGKCMSKPADIDVGKLLSITNQWAKDKEIDSVSNLKESKVYLYSGTLDSTVKSGIVMALKTYYEGLVNPKNIFYKNDVASEHAMITNQAGKACNSKDSPFINNCQFDLAGAILNHLYKKLKPASIKALPNENFIEFDQTEFVAGHGMALTGWAYIPQSCKMSKEPCKVHVALHGCQQNTSDVKLEFIQNAGYNRWADSNNMIVLYPQTGKGSTNSCWDWWGYDSANYAKKSGPQMSAIKAMVDRVATTAK